MTPAPHDLNNDALARSLGDQLHRVGDAVHAPPPPDGRSRIQSRVQHHRRTRRVQSGLAAVVALAVLVAGIAVLAGRGEEDGAPVVAGPDPAEAGWLGLPLLAPDGIAWWVTDWTPSAPSTAMVEFDDGGFTWHLSILGKEGWLEDVSSTAGSTTSVGDREVWTSEVLLPGGAVQGVVDLGWTEPDGTTVALSVVKQTDDPASGFRTLTADDPLPSTESALDLVAKIRSSPPDTWREALMASDGEPEPGTGATTRPLRLGPPRGLRPLAGQPPPVDGGRHRVRGGRRSKPVPARGHDRSR